MRIRLLNRFMGPLIAVVLALGVLAPAVAQEASPEPEAAPAIVEDLDRSRAEREAAREERRAERAAAREERQLAQAVRREERNVARELARAERAQERDERKAVRDERRAARTEAREVCADELRAVRDATWDDRTAFRAALAEAREACRAAFLAAAGAGESAIDELYSDAAVDASGVVRTDLGLADPASAEGQQLGLWHYLIPAGEELAPHTHPGWQLARITDGELEYTVLAGEGVLLRADGSRQPIGPGTYQLGTGDGVIENPELVHRGANRSDGPVTIISATLFEADEPLATVVEESQMAEE